MPLVMGTKESARLFLYGSWSEMISILIAKEKER